MTLISKLQLMKERAVCEAGGGGLMEGEKSGENTTLIVNWSNPNLYLFSITQQSYNYNSVVNLILLCVEDQSKSMIFFKW